MANTTNTKTLIFRRDELGYFDELLEQLNFDPEVIAEVDEVVVEMHKWTAVAS